MRSADAARALRDGLAGLRHALTASGSADAEDDPLVGPDDRTRPDAPDDARHLVVVTLDSLRLDSAQAARTPNLDALGSMERRWAYATWTAPSHHNLLCGLLPHDQPRRTFASTHHREDLARWGDRIGTRTPVGFEQLLPTLWLPDLLRGLGYTTHALVSMPVLNPSTPLSVGFDRWELAPRFNDGAAIVDRVDLGGGRPTFHLLNLGETHYPYATVDDDLAAFPRISGLHGVAKRLGTSTTDPAVATSGEPAWFDAATMAMFRDRQVAAAEAADAIVGRLLDCLPAGTSVVVTADHGELFGEDDLFGHGPIAHEKVLEVPYWEGGT